MDGLELSEEQKDKLAKLDMELKRRAEYEKANKTRKEQQSLATGIPTNIIDLDVIRIGKFLEPFILGCIGVFLGFFVFLLLLMWNSGRI